MFYTELSHRVDGRFLYYYATCFQFGQYSTNTALPSMAQEDLANIYMAAPGPSEQALIAAFLDHETARIDALVEEQQRLIELLKEKRQAVISHAVTKGLDPNVPMKDSGVEWLGEVPAHWVVAPIKIFFSFLDGKRIPLKSEDRGGRQGDFPYYGASGVIDWIDDFIFDQDHVLVSEDGANLLARSSPIAFVATGRYWVNNHAHILKPIDENLEYWAEVIENLDLCIHVTGSAQPKLTSEALGSIDVASPPSSDERLKIKDKITEAEPPRLFRRPVCLSQAASPDSSS
jgi:type I restriction enzyme S subunit